MWNGGIVTFCVVWTAPLTPSNWGFCIPTGSLSQEEFPIFSPGFILSELLWDSCNDPDMTAPKWACYQVSHVCKFPHSHATQSPVYNFWTHHDWNSFSVGCGGYSQQQHILVVASNPQNLEVNLHKSEVRNSYTPIPYNSNNWPKSWISRSRSLHNCMLIFDTSVPKSIKAATLHPSITTLLACPTKCATGSGFRNGMGVILFHPFLFTALTWVGFGLGPERECCELTECCWRGVWPHSLGSPHPGLMFWLEWCTPLPCDPNPGIWNITMSWSPLCSEHHPVHHSVPIYSPFVQNQCFLCLQLRNCEQKQFDPGQSNHCGSWGG